MTVAELIQYLQENVDQNVPIMVSAPAVGNVDVTEEMIQDWVTQVTIFIQ
jgi:hypothetical protein